MGFTMGQSGIEAELGTKRARGKRGFRVRCAALAVLGLVSMGDTCVIQDTPTKYPIVLAHGFAGWGEAEGDDYFYGVKQNLELLGYTVFEPTVSPVNAIDVRAGELASAILDQFPRGKVNVIAHSMGGLDARYMISHLGMDAHVASLVMLSTPNHGCAVSDVAVGALPGATQEIIDFILSFWGLSWDGVVQTTTQYVEETLNPTTPDMPGVSYYSYGGNGLFLLNPKLWLSYPIVLQYQGVNDGMVGVSSAQWGTYLDTLNADHFDEVNQPPPPNPTEFDALDFYTNLARFLQKNGF